MLSYILAVIVSFLGLLVGSLLVYMAPEEQKPGRKYFVFVQNIILALITSTLLFSYKLDIGLIVMLSLIVFVLSCYIKNPRRSYVLYPLMGAFFYIVLNDNNMVIILSMLTFTYGLATAFLLVNTKDKKSILNILLNHSAFLLTALLPFLISYL